MPTHKFRIVIGNQYRNGIDSIRLARRQRIFDGIQPCDRSHQSAWGHVANSKSKPSVVDQRTFSWNTAACK
ncbi:hypothetical protein [uncultured Nostoc sp.]|uniref:hypothetical protein n=1 Tax=uncultured Nostoc sp. TaxID=340711 RepID=UPI0026032743|nr:hypothetical protein [uncultured Nostoc sp.]